MDYIKSMQRLAKYREEKRAAGHKLTAAYNIVNRAKERISGAKSIDKYNVASQAGLLIDKYSSDAKPRLGENVQSYCNELDIAYEGEIKKATVAYERRMNEIQAGVREELKRGENKPLSQNVGKIMALLVLGCTAFVMLLIVPVMMKPFLEGALLGDSHLSETFTIIGIGSVVAFLLVLMHKKKADETKISRYVQEVKELTPKYYGYIAPIFERAYKKIEESYNENTDKLAEQIKAEIGERVFFLFENTPYNQQEYFMKLGMTASSEEDFNSIAQECLKADKTEQQINVQNMINIETRNSINQGIEKLNRTARQMHEDAEFRARQQAEHNAQIARQNERNLGNQAKALDEMKKQRKRTEELEYQIRHRSDN